VQPALRAFWPALAGRGVVQLSSLLDQVLSTLLAVGAVSALSYAQVLYLLPVSLFGQSIAAAALPDLSAAGESATRQAIAARTRRALGRTGFLNLPVAVAYLCLGPILMGAVYRVLPGGRFGAADAWLVGMVLGAYALGLPASTGSRVLQSTFFAMGDTRTPARVAAGRMVAGVAVALPTMIVLDRVRLIDVPGLGGLGGALRLGAIGLAFGASVAAWLEWGLLSRSLASRLSGFRWPVSEALRVLAASLVGAAAGLGAARFLAARLAPLPLALVTAASFGAAFLAVGMASGLPELERVMASLRRSRS
jgi:putative peptidoglycan lipid II flippase